MLRLTDGERISMISYNTRSWRTDRQTDDLP